MNTADSDLIQTVIPDSRIRLGSAQQAPLAVIPEITAVITASGAAA